MVFLSLNHALFRKKVTTILANLHMTFFLFWGIRIEVFRLFGNLRDG